MFKDAEERVNKFGNVSYWKDGVLVGRKCTKCGEDKEIGEFCFLNKEQNTYDSICKECKKEKDIEEKIHDLETIDERVIYLRRIGYTVEEIAETVFLSPRQVYRYLRRIREGD